MFGILEEKWNIDLFFSIYMYVDLYLKIKNITLSFSFTPKSSIQTLHNINHFLNKNWRRKMCTRSRHHAHEASWSGAAVCQNLTLVGSRPYPWTCRLVTWQIKEWMIGWFDLKVRAGLRCGVGYVNPSPEAFGGTENGNMGPTFSYIAGHHKPILVFWTERIGLMDHTSWH